MSCHGEWSESAKVSSVLQRDETEGKNDQQNGFLMNMPAKQEGRVAAEGHSSDEVVPGCIQKQFDQRRDHRGKRQGEAHVGSYLRQYGKGSISNKTSSHAIHRVKIYGKPEAWRNCDNVSSQDMTTCKSDPVRTIDQKSVGEGIHRPDVRCPICMAQSSRKGEKSAQNLRQLVPECEGAERSAKDSCNATAQFDAVEPLDAED